MSDERSICLYELSAQLMGYEGEDGRFVEGVFTELLGFRSSTTKLRTAHLMNDLAQATIGRLPDHDGDLISRVIRVERVGREEDKGEDNSDEVLRADERLGELYSAAFPEGQLSGPERWALREAVGLLVNHDKRVFKAGDKMASPVATHWQLLGAEGFRRFGVGAYLAGLLGARVRARLCELFEGDSDPVSRALAPLLLGEPKEVDVSEGAVTLSPFDEALSKGLENLLKHRADKATLLRHFAFGATLGLVLKFYGVGSEDGVPCLLALPAESSLNGRLLRSQAVQALSRGLERFERRVASHLVHTARWEALINSSGDRRDELMLSEPLSPEGEAMSALSALKDRPAPTKQERAEGRVAMYWPELFINSLGAQVGLIGPKNQGGWAKHLTLTPELLEVLMLMALDPEGEPMSWEKLWEQLSLRFGVMVGVNQDTEATRLETAGVAFMNLEDMFKNSELFLEQAIDRGVARRLPDSGAEAGVMLR